MLGSIFKYTCVAVAGAVGFAMFGHFTDIEVIEQVKLSIEDVSIQSSDLSDDERKLKIRNFIDANRSGWVARLVFSANVTELDAVLSGWL